MKAIHHVVDIDAATATAWAALTEPQRLARWWSTEVDAPEPKVGARTHWTFAGDFNPVMETVTLEPGREVVWRCVGGHDPWADSTFRFTLVPRGEGRCRLRFWQDYAVELDDDAYGVYNFNWGYYLESLRVLCTTGTGTPFRPSRPPEHSEATTHQTRLAHESADYRAARGTLQVAEIDLMRHRERVAELRRSLPDGPTVEDYALQEGPADLDGGDEPRRVRLSELFTAPDRTLVLYHLMYGKRQATPCPMCTMWLDGLNGVAPHLRQNVDFAVVAAAELPALREHARRRDWRHLRLLSAGTSTLKYDLGSEDETGNQDSTISVFRLDGDAAIRHVYTAHPRMAEDIGERGIDLLSPVWHLLDLTPQGRGDWYPELTYPPAG
jgi:predicted dithiol-disulfide oxidoreductase (DUF899 family)/uncharacterized protein YndB with AHSA1/START domain